MRCNRCGLLMYGRDHVCPALTPTARVPEPAEAPRLPVPFDPVMRTALDRLATSGKRLSPRAINHVIQHHAADFSAIEDRALVHEWKRLAPAVRAWHESIEANRTREAAPAMDEKPKQYQVITIHADGSVSGLERKRGQGLDLKQFGAARVERVSHIVWVENEAGRGWKIEFLLGPRAGKTLAWRDLFVAPREVFDLALNVAQRAGNGVEPVPDQPVLFDDYDDAVKVEVAILDHDRLNGRHP